MATEYENTQDAIDEARAALQRASQHNAHERHHLRQLLNQALEAIEPGALIRNALQILQEKL